MKHIVTLSLACILAFSCKAQQIIDMAANNNMDGKYENGTYYHKDVNNYFDAFVGTWKYEYDTNKEFRIVLTKVEMYHDVGETLNFNYYTDGLLINYKKYENGSLIYESPTFDYPTGSFENPTKIGMSFIDYERLSAVFNLNLTLSNAIGENNQQETKLHFNLIIWNSENPYHDEHPDEPYFSVPNDILMTRIE